MSAGSAAEPPGLERRRAPRFVPQQLAEPVYVVGSKLVDIGIKGLLLEAPVPLSPDSSLRLRLVVGGMKGEVKGRVRRCVARDQGRQRAWGLGVEFEQMSVELRERLAHALEPRRVGRA